MSHEAYTPAMVPPTPEAAHAPVAPEEQFASHVAWVREQGDALDRRSMLWPSRAATLGTMANFVVGLTAVNGDIATSKTTLTFAVANAGVWGYTMLKDALFSRPKALSRLDEPTQQALNLDYELLRAKVKDGPDEVVLLYRGQHSDRTGETEGEALARMAKLAKENDITAMAIPATMGVFATSKSRVAQKTNPGEQQERTTARQMLHQTKRLRTSGRTQLEQVDVAKPAYWQDVAGGLEHEIDGREIDGLLEQLAGVNPLHPALRKAHEYRENTEARGQQLQSLLKTVLGTQLGSAEMVPYAGSRQQGVGRHPTRQKVHSTAHITGEFVEFRVNGSMVHRQPLDEALQLHGGRLELLLQNGDPRFRQERQTALEYLTYRTLYRAEQAAYAPPVIQEEGVRAMPPRMAPLQREIITGRGREGAKHDIKLTAQSVKRLGALGLGMVIGLAAAGGGTIFFDKRYDQVRHEAAVEIARERGIASNDVSTVPASAIDHRLAEWSGANTAWGGWYNLRKAPPEGNGGGDPGYDDPTGDANGEYGVGNFEDTNPRAVWSLESQNGMDASGYWIADTSNLVDRQPCTVPCDFNIVWPVETTAKVDHEMVQMATAPGQDQLTEPYTRVSRTLQAGAFINESTKVYTLPLPILQGSDIFAINLNGKPAPLVARNDGTIALQIMPDDGEFAVDKPMQLEYWVKPKLTDSGGAFGRDRGTSVWSESPNDTNEKINAVFSKYVPGYAAAGLDQDKKRQAVYDYIKHDFLYTTHPMNDEERKSITDYTSFAEELLKRKLGVCNTDSTLLILADPRLTAAFGFFNAPGEGADKLMSGEAHMVTMDGKKIIDPVSENVFVEPNEQPGESAPILPWLILAGALQLGGAGFIMRKPLAEAVRQQRVHHATRVADSADAQLQATDAFTLNMAANAAEARWAPGGAVTAHDAATRAHLFGGTWQEARARVAAPEFRDPAVAAHLKRQGWDTTHLLNVHELARQSGNRPAYHKRRK